MTIILRQSVVILLCATAACQSGGESANVATRLLAISGESQSGEPDEPLTQPVQFQVLNAASNPVANVAVTFAVTLGNGHVASTSATTDASGLVQTIWTIGNEGEIQELTAQASQLTASATATLCKPGSCYPSERLEGPLSDASLLNVVTYDGSGQAVHPDIVHGAGSNSGYWLALTPYPNGDATHENPSIFRSADALNWQVPAGVSNPLALPGINAGYLSDPDMVYNGSDKQLWMYYRAASNVLNVISVMKSPDGVHWSTPSPVITVDAHQLVSPSIVRGAPHAPWVMWGVNAGKQGCSAVNTSIERRTSTDGINWSAPASVDLVQPGEAIWHIDVEWIPARSEYWAIYNTYPVGTACSTHSLWLARSSDGTHWTTSPSPVARSGVISAFADVIYRASMLVDARAAHVTLWMSGAKLDANSDYRWSTATISLATADLFNIINAPAVHARASDYRVLPFPEQ